MDVFEAIAGRRSIRSYVPMPVPEEKLRRVLEAAQKAPSAGNRQEYRFIVVTNEETKKRLAEAASQQAFVGEAGAVIVACATNPERRWHAVDVAIAIDHMTLAAYAEGLGTCWIGAFDEDAVKPVVGVPDNIKVVMLLTVGIPADKGRERPRKSLDDLVCYEKWQE